MFHYQIILLKGWHFFADENRSTSIQHLAPGFGHDDYKIYLKYGIIKPCDPLIPIDSSGKFLESVKDFSGMYIKDADKKIRQYLKSNERLIKDCIILHHYPFCPRSQTPLIYKAVNFWFIKVADIKDNLFDDDRQVQQTIQDIRFQDKLDDSQDWCFSRNRFWGNPIPLWVRDDFEEVVCIGSIEELKQFSEIEKITDLYREFINHITIPSKQGSRIEAVFDSWFESCSIPFAFQNYPFEKNYPIHFIAEGLKKVGFMHQIQQKQNKGDKKMFLRMELYQMIKMKRLKAIEFIQILKKRSLIGLVLML